MFALMLAVVGLYSVVCVPGVVPVQRIWHPYGARCRSRRIVNAAVQPAVLAIVAGLFARLALSVGLNKVVAQWSIGNLNDPAVLVAVSLVLFVVTMMSAAIPANRLPRFSRQTRFGPTEHRPAAPSSARRLSVKGLSVNYRP